MKEINQIRITNLVSINLPLLLMMPYYIYQLGDNNKLTYQLK